MVPLYVAQVSQILADSDSSGGKIVFWLIVVAVLVIRGIYNHFFNNDEPDNQASPAVPQEPPRRHIGDVMRRIEQAKQRARAAGQASGTPMQPRPQPVPFDPSLPFNPPPADAWALESDDDEFEPDRNVTSVPAYPQVEQQAQAAIHSLSNAEQAALQRLQQSQQPQQPQAAALAQQPVHQPQYSPQAPVYGAGALGTRSQVQQAMLFYEILGKPRALQGDRFGF